MHVQKILAPWRTKKEITADPRADQMTSDQRCEQGYFVLATETGER